jgi:hypothetical protein
MLSQAVVGQAVSATNRVVDPDGANQTNQTYAWEKSTNGTTWTTIAGATTSTYTPAVADKYNLLRLKYGYKDANNNVESFTSSPTTVIADNGPVLKKVSFGYQSNNVTGVILQFDENLGSGASLLPSVGAGLTIQKYDNGVQNGAIFSGTNTVTNSPNDTLNAFLVNNFAVFTATDGPQSYAKFSYNDSNTIDNKAIQDTSGNAIPQTMDILMFGRGNDTINGNTLSTAYQKYLMGGGGNDTIQGGYGNQVMWGLDTLLSPLTNPAGGTDNDTFKWGSGDATNAIGPVAGGNTLVPAIDTIKDFSKWNGTAGDKLDFTGFFNNFNSNTSDISKWITSIYKGLTVNGVANCTVINIDTDGTDFTSADWKQIIVLENVDLGINGAGAAIKSQIEALKTSGVFNY